MPGERIRRVDHLLHAPNFSAGRSIRLASRSPSARLAGLEDFKRELDRAVAQADDPILRASTARARAIVGMPSTPFSNVMPRPLTSGPAITSAK